MRHFIRFSILYIFWPWIYTCSMVLFMTLCGSWSLTATRVVMPFHRAFRQRRDRLQAPCMGMIVSVWVGDPDRQGGNAKERILITYFSAFG